MAIHAKFTNLQGIEAYASKGEMHADEVVAASAHVAHDMYSLKEMIMDEVRRPETSQEERRRYREYVARIVY